MSKIYQVRIMDFCLSLIVKEWCVTTFTFLLIVTIIIIVILCYCSHLEQVRMINFLVSWKGEGLKLRQSLPFCMIWSLDQDSPLIKRGRIIVLYILIFRFLDRWGRRKILDWMVAGASWLQSAFNFFMNIILI
jgi:hypothetical protein